MVIEWRCRLIVIVALARFGLKHTVMEMLMKARATVICRKDDRVLYVRKRNSKWSLPGGKIEPDETPVEAAARELEEETGLVTDDLVYLARFEKDDTVHYIFITALQSGEKASPKNEISACKWGHWKRFREVQSSRATKAIVKNFAALNSEV